MLKWRALAGFWGHETKYKDVLIFVFALSTTGNYGRATARPFPSLSSSHSQPAILNSARLCDAARLEDNPCLPSGRGLRGDQINRSKSELVTRSDGGVCVPGTP